MEDKLNKGILDEGIYDNPKYKHLRKFFEIGVRGFWTPGRYEKRIKDIDAALYRRMEIADQTTVKRCILTIAMVEDKVKNFWNTLYNRIPQTAVSDVGAIFGLIEAVHRIAYHSLVKEIGVDLAEIEEHPVLRDRLAYLNKHLEKDPKIIGKKRILKELVLFTALIEKGSLFSQFYILMSYANANRGLKAISSLQQATATEELSHFNFGIALIDVIKKEYPQLWDDYLIELISKNLDMAYQAEMNLVDWFFEEGVPSHLTREEVINFINYNFTDISVALGIENNYDFDKELYDKENAWMFIQLHSSEPDFFDNNVGGYDSEETQVDLDDIDWTI